TSPLVDDDLDEEEAIKVTKKKIIKNDIEDETLEIDEIVNIKKSKNHPLENVIGNLNQRTLRLDIIFSVRLCALFQEAPKTSYLEAVKYIFQYIKDTTKLGLWYPKGTGIETVVYVDSDHAVDYVDRKSTSAKNRFMELNEPTELRDGAYKNTRIYKERTKKWHDFRLRGDKNSKVGDKVLLFKSRF
nr:retrovirus-related Pol polyprotein from transposon TNT 1-94 [Tanacetum cinerariifolium]